MSHPVVSDAGNDARKIELMRKSPELPRDSYLELDVQNRVPLYHQIFERFRGKIRDGEYSQGDYLPGEREISQSYKVSRITAVRALNELAASGLVVRERGRGTRVQLVASGTITRGPVAIHSSVGVSKPMSIGEPLDLLRGARTTEFEVKEFEYIAGPTDVIEAMRLEPGTEVQHAARVSRFDGRPYHHLRTYVPADIARHWEREDLLTTPLSQLLVRAGVRIGSIDELVTATIAETVLVERLDVPEGSPLLSIRRRTTDVDGRPVEYLIGHYSPERYQYAVSLTPHLASLEDSSLAPVAVRQTQTRTVSSKVAPAITTTRR